MLWELVEGFRIFLFKGRERYFSGLPTPTLYLKKHYKNRIKYVFDPSGLTIRHCVNLAHLTSELSPTYCTLPLQIGGKKNPACLKEWAN